MNTKSICILFFLSFIFSLKIQAENTEKEIRCKAYSSLLDSLVNSEANYEIEKALQIKEEVTRLECSCLTQAYNLLGYLHYNNSNLQEAKRYLLLSEETYLLSDKRNPYSYAKNQILQGLVSIVEENYEIALFHLEKSKELAEAAKDNKLLALVCINLGLVKLEMQELEAAKELYLKVINLETPKFIQVGYAYQNLARIFSWQKQYPEALAMIEKTRQFWKDFEHQKGLFFLSQVEATNYYEMGQYEKAHRVLLKGREIGKQENIHLLQGESYLLEAKIYKAQNKFGLEKRAIENALTYSEELTFEEIEFALKNLGANTKTTQASISELLLEIIKKNKTKHTELSSLALDKGRIMDNQLKKNEVVERQYAKGVSRINRQNNFIIVLLIFFLLLSILLCSLYKQKTKINKLNANLLSSNNAIEQQLTRLAYKNKELKQFAYVASHDLKSPLRTISSFSGLIEKKVQDAELLEYLKFIKTSANQMTALISDLLNNASSDKNLKVEKANFTEIVKEAINNLHAEIDEKRVEIHFDESIPINIKCDRLKICQVVQNLLNNAISYSKKGQRAVIEIKTQVEGKVFVFSIKDNGIGIKEAYQEKIFDMFYRLKENPEVAGTGIGLATCKKIIELHGGAIILNSVYGQGTEFSIQLPQ